MSVASLIVIWAWIAILTGFVAFLCLEIRDIKKEIASIKSNIRALFRIAGDDRP